MAVMCGVSGDCDRRVFPCGKSSLGRGGTSCTMVGAAAKFGVPAERLMVVELAVMVGVVMVVLLLVMVNG